MIFFYYQILTIRDYYYENAEGDIHTTISSSCFSLFSFLPSEMEDEILIKYFSSCFRLSQSAD
jgi:hypothetical protein